MIALIIGVVVAVILTIYFGVKIEERKQTRNEKTHQALLDENVRLSRQVHDLMTDKINLKSKCQDSFYEGAKSAVTHEGKSEKIESDWIRWKLRQLGP